MFQQIDTRLKQLTASCFDALGGSKGLATVSGVGVVIVLVVILCLHLPGQIVKIVIDDPTAKVFINGNHVQLAGVSGYVTFNSCDHSVSIKQDNATING